MKILGVIPARYGSTRFPGKPLALIGGKPMILHVYQRCLKADRLDKAVVATDDRRIYDCVLRSGGQAEMTSSRHRSGSDRIAEVIRKPGYRGYGIVLNIQGDEPLIDPKAVDLLAKGILSDGKIQMATLATRFSTAEEIESPHTAKIVTDDSGRALYFSRFPIPYDREGRNRMADICLKHIGMYAYRRGFLLEFAGWPEGRLEKLEKLEQLRALEKGAAVKVILTKYNCLSVDSPEDIKSIEEHTRAAGPTAKWS